MRIVRNARAGRDENIIEIPHKVRHKKRVQVSGIPEDRQPVRGGQWASLSIAQHGDWIDHVDFFRWSGSVRFR
jgi:hypothetical protein